MRGFIGFSTRWYTRASTNEPVDDSLHPQNPSAFSAACKAAVEWVSIVERRVFAAYTDAWHIFRVRIFGTSRSACSSHRMADRIQWQSVPDFPAGCSSSKGPSCRGCGLDGSREITLLPCDGAFQMLVFTSLRTKHVPSATAFCCSQQERRAAHMIRWRKRGGTRWLEWMGFAWRLLG